MPGAVRDFKEEWDVFRYLIGDKMFLMDGKNKEGQHILTFKLEPLHGELAREKYPEITAGYYMNKVHWNSMRCDGNVPDEVLREYLQESYRLILSSLPKKTQQALNSK